MLDKRQSFLIHNCKLANRTDSHASSLFYVALKISDPNALAQEFYYFDEKVFERKKI